MLLKTCISCSLGVAESVGVVRMNILVPERVGLDFAYL